MVLCIGNVGVLRAGFKALMILGPSVVAPFLGDFWKYSRKFRDSALPFLETSDIQ